MTAQIVLQIGLILLIVFLLSISARPVSRRHRHGSEDPVGSGLRPGRRGHILVDRPGRHTPADELEGLHLSPAGDQSAHGAVDLLDPRVPGLFAAEPVEARRDGAGAGIQHRHQLHHQHRLASGPGLDPDISPADAALQVARVARARRIPIAEINGLLQRHITGRSLGIFGEPRVNVLALNLALEEKYPKSSASLTLQDQSP